MKYASAVAGAALALVCTAASLPAQAAAPNYNAYCAQRFLGSVVTRHNATGELLCTVRSTYSLMHYQLNYAEACNTQYGSPAYRKIGPGTVDCTVRASGPSGPSGVNTRVLSTATAFPARGRTTPNRSASGFAPSGPTTDSASCIAPSIFPALATS